MKAPLRCDDVERLQVLHRCATLETELGQTMTRLKQAQEELNWKTAFLEAQANSAIDGIIVVDQQGRKILQNQRTAELFKIPRHIVEDPDDAAQVRWVTDMTRHPSQFIEKVVHLYSHPDEISRDEIELKDGTMLDRYSAPVAKDGTYYGRIWTFRDITEHKRTEMALREREERLRAALLASGTGTFRWDIRSNEVSWDEALDALFGLSPGRTVRSLETFIATVHPDDRAGVIERCERCAREGADFDMEFRVLWPDGSLHWLEDRGKTRLDEAGKPLYMTGACVDITERKHATEALRTSEEKFHQLANNINDVFWITSPDFKTMHFISAGYEMIWGRSAESLYANPHQWVEAILPEERDRVFGVFATLMNNTAEVNVEYRIARPDGTVRWIHDRGFQVRDATGALVRLTGIATDVTERKRVEQATERTLQRLHDAQRIGQIGDWEWDIATQVITWSPQVFVILGRDPKLGPPCNYEEQAAFYDAASLALMTEKVTRAIETGEPQDYELRGRLPNDELVDVLGRAVPRRDASGRVVGLSGTIQDITERKRTEQTLRLLSSAVEQSKESIMITDAELDLPGPKIIFVNPAFTQMTGYTAAEVIGRTPRMLQGPRTDRTVLNRLRHNLEQGEVFAGEAINYRKDGTEFDLEWQIAPMRSASGAISHFVAVQRDITGRKRLEAQLLQSQKMETVGRLAGGVAHEFNSILTAIIGQSELLIGDLPTGGTRAKNAAEIRKAADRAATLTRQLLAYGRKQLLKPEALDLNEVITGMSGMLHHLMGGEVNTQIIPAPSLHAVQADAGQMEQVIMNMVINARDAMPGGGKLTLETANVTLDQTYLSQFQESELSAGDYVMLAITDSGAGMSAGVKARVFEPFFTTKGVGQGTGLGLSSCYGIIKQSGGHISVYSEPGRGTTFKIYLPQMAVQSQAPARRPAPADLPRGTETILLVEDDPALREMATTLLSRLGYTVLAAANGIEALTLKQQFETGDIDLLFTDVVMPHMSGKELVDRVQALDPTIRILFTSAYTTNAIIHQGVLKQDVTLLQKPFTPSALAHKLRDVLGPPRDGVNTP